MKNFILLLLLVFSVTCSACSAKHDSYIGKEYPVDSLILQDIVNYLQDIYPPDTSFTLLTSKNEEFHDELEKELRKCGYIITLENADISITYEIDTLLDKSIYVLLTLKQEKESKFISRIYDEKGIQKSSISQTITLEE